MVQPRPVVTVLVVDGEEQVLEFVKEVLGHLPGTHAIVAKSGQEALDLLDRHVDLIISDLRMPGMDGVRFLGEARIRFPETPRIMMASLPSLELTLAALHEAKVKKFLTKPLDPQKLLAAVVDVLSHRRVWRPPGADTS